MITLRTGTISDSFRWFPAQHKAWPIAHSQYVSGMNRIQESRATKVPVLHAFKTDAEDRKGGMRTEDEGRICEWAGTGGLGPEKNTRSKVAPGVGARWAWRDAYLRLRYCNDFISLEKPLRVSIWLSRRCKVVRLLRFSKPSTFFNMFWA